MVIALILAAGIGVGMAIDSGRATVQAQAAPTQVTAPEHGAFTSMAYRDPSVIQQRFVGSDANLDPS